MTIAEVEDQLLRFLGGGIKARLGPRLRDYYYGIAAALKTWCADQVDVARRELNPLLMEQKVPDWEAAMALGDSKIAKTGTITARRHQVIAQLRQHGSLSIPDLRAALQPFFLYADPAQIEVIETDRAALRTAHTYAGTTAGGFPAAVPTAFPPRVIFFNVIDDGPVGPAGAQLRLKLSGYPNEMTIALVGPDGVTQQAFWAPGYLPEGPVVEQQYMLYAPRDKVFGQSYTATKLAGQVAGQWSLRILAPGGHMSTVHEADLFVEAVGRNAKGGDGLGAAMFEFQVVADPALLGPGADLAAADKLIQKIKPGYTLGRVLRKSGVMGGGRLAIPDTDSAIPDAGIPG